MSSGITISLQLEVVGGNITIPGCEAPSAFSSTLLLRYTPCCTTYIKVEDALAAIPGSYLKRLPNTGEPIGFRQWFVLPAHDTGCPCVDKEDYYKILREISCEEEPEEPDLGCEPVNMGYCPPRDLSMLPAVPATTVYYSEATPPSNLGSLLYGGYAIPGPTLDAPPETDQVVIA